MKFRTITDIAGLTSPYQREEEPVVKPTIEEDKLQGKQVLFAWEASARRSPRQISNKLKKNLMIVAVVIGFLLLILQEYLLIAVVASVAFISYALSKTPPEILRHQITSHGASFAGKFYEWAELKGFFFSTAFGGTTLVVNTVDKLPGRLFFNFKPEDKDKLKEIFERYLTFIEEEPLTVIDKSYLSVIDRLNIDGKPKT